MYPYETSQFSNVNPTQSSPFQHLQGPGFQSSPTQNYPNAAQFQRHNFGVIANPSAYQSAFAFQTPQPYQGVGSPQFNPQFQGAQQGSEYGFASRQPFLSPEEFAGNLTGQFAGNRQSTLGNVDPIFITELSRSARGLQDVAEQLEGVQTQPPGQSQKDDIQRKGIYAATAHLFYAFGLLSSKGIFISGDLPGKLRSEVGGPANACREFGKQLERFVDKAATGRSITDELSRLVERGTACYAEITRTIEGSDPGEQQSRKKVAA